MMTDNTDLYISRCLKNWTARYPAPGDGKAELLNQASRPVIINEPVLVRFLSGVQVRMRTADDQIYPHSRLSFMEPFTLSTLWSFHMVANTRLAT
jgi:hypothetical protein